ncbi:dienelactone hydrolase family protein [Lusitaniella coriacea]|uniref:dienelactone hydrolase family protein n=1 Tax=Lusitaniella coriacea TaxID=1983105 RepID=UPI003CEDB446
MQSKIYRGKRMQVEHQEIIISTPDGEMPIFVCSPIQNSRKPVVMLLMEAFGLTQHIKDVAVRIAKEGYVVITPDLYYRELPNNKFGYDEVEEATTMMWQLDFGKPMEDDIEATLTYIKSRKDVDPDRVGVTGFCLGGGLTFFTATKFSSEITVAAPFYGMVFDEWIEAVTNITIPVYLFFGEIDPFIKRDRVKQIESRFKELGKNYKLKVYPNAEHGFFCHERSSYNASAAEDSWHELIEFFRQYLQVKEG